MTNIEAAAWKIDDTLVGRHDKCTRPVKAGMWPQTALQINGSGEVETHRRGSVRPASMLATEGATLIRRIRKSARALSVANNQNFISWRKARANKNQRAQQRKLRPKGSVSRGADSCWYCSSGISSDAARSKSSGYAGEPVEVKRPTESGAQRPS